MSKASTSFFFETFSCQKLDFAFLSVKLISNLPCLYNVNFLTSLVVGIDKSINVYHNTFDYVCLEAKSNRKTDYTWSDWTISLYHLHVGYCTKTNQKDLYHRTRDTLSIKNLTSNQSQFHKNMKEKEWFLILDYMSCDNFSNCDWLPGSEDLLLN